MTGQGQVPKVTQYSTPLSPQRSHVSESLRSPAEDKPSLKPEFPGWPEDVVDPGGRGSVRECWGRRHSVSGVLAVRPGSESESSTHVNHCAQSYAAATHAEVVLRGSQGLPGHQPGSGFMTDPVSREQDRDT